jgi:hypothetical protein
MLFSLLHGPLLSKRKVHSCKQCTGWPSHPGRYLFRQKENAVFKILFTRAWEILNENRRAYITVNVVYYGLVIICMVYAAFNQPLQAEMLKTGNENMMTGALSMLGRGYDTPKILNTLIHLYFGNLLGASYALISLPSFFIPFSGLLTGAYHAIQWGLLFSPANLDIRVPMIMHSLALVIEGQAYILAMLGAYIQGCAMIWPHTVGLKSRWQAYVEGFRQTGTLYMLIMPVLAISAIYGFIEVVVLSGLMP